MLKLLLLTLLFVSSLFASKVLYVQYAEVPKRVIKGEIVPVTLKTLSVVKNFRDIRYSFTNQRGIKVLDGSPQRVKRGKFYYDTFRMLITGSNAVLPNVKVTLVPHSANYDPTYVQGQRLNVITLNPPKDFSNILADSLILKEYKTTSYDTMHNIVVFVLEAKNSNLHNIHFNSVYKQGVESLSGGYYHPKVTYYVVIEKNIDFFKFSYFNLKENKYEQITIPIVVDDDSVTTQTDLKPRDQSHEQLKMYIALGVALLALLLFVLKKQILFIVLFIVPMIYIAYLSIPQKEVCVKAGAKIYLLPVQNGTVFETTQMQQEFTKEGSVDKFVKVRLQNDKIGWVKNEDTCSY